MAKDLGHNSPLGAFRNLGSWVQRRSLGISPLSILNLKTFYPQGFPVVSTENTENESQPSASTARSENESQPSSSGEIPIARKVETSAHQANTSVPSLDSQTSRPRETSPSVSPDSFSVATGSDFTNAGSDSTSSDSTSSDSTDSTETDSTAVEQAIPFRTSLQRYFLPNDVNPSSGTDAADAGLLQRDLSHTPAPPDHTTLPSDLAPPTSTPPLQPTPPAPPASASDSDPATLTKTSADFIPSPTPLSTTTESPQASDAISVQRSTVEPTYGPTQPSVSPSSPHSVADITDSIQRLTSPLSTTPASVSQTSANAPHSDLQPSTDVPKGQSSGQPDTPPVSPSIADTDTNPATPPQPPPLGLTSTDINQSIQSLRNSSDAVQRAPQPRHVEQSANVDIQSIGSTSSPVQRLTETSTAQPSLRPHGHTPTTVSPPHQEQPFQPQADATSPVPLIDPASSPLAQETSVQRTPDQDGAPLVQRSDSGNAAESPQSMIRPTTQSTTQSTIQPSALDGTPANSHQTTLSPPPAGSKDQPALASEEIPAKATSVHVENIQRQFNSPANDLPDAGDVVPTHSPLDQRPSTTANLNLDHNLDNNGGGNIPVSPKAQSDTTTPVQLSSDSFNTAGDATVQASLPAHSSSSQSLGISQVSSTTQEPGATPVQRTQNFDNPDNSEKVQASSSQQPVRQAADTYPVEQLTDSLSITNLTSSVQRTEEVAQSSMTNAVEKTIDVHMVSERADSVQRHDDGIQMSTVDAVEEAADTLTATNSAAAVQRTHDAGQLPMADAVETPSNGPSVTDSADLVQRTHDENQSTITNTVGKIVNAPSVTDSTESVQRTHDAGQLPMADAVGTPTDNPSVTASADSVQQTHDAAQSSIANAVGKIVDAPTGANSTDSVQRTHDEMQLPMADAVGQPPDAPSVTDSTESVQRTGEVTQSPITNAIKKTATPLTVTNSTDSGQPTRNAAQSPRVTAVGTPVGTPTDSPSVTDSTDSVQRTHDENQPPVGTSADNPAVTDSENLVQRTGDAAQPSITNAVGKIVDAPSVTDSTESVQRTHDAGQLPIADAVRTPTDSPAVTDSADLVQRTGDAAQSSITNAVGKIVDAPSVTDSTESVQRTHDAGQLPIADAVGTPTDNPSVTDSKGSVQRTHDAGQLPIADGVGQPTDGQVVSNRADSVQRTHDDLPQSPRADAAGTWADISSVTAPDLSDASLQRTPYDQTQPPSNQASPSSHQGPPSVDTQAVLETNQVSPQTQQTTSLGQNVSHPNIQRSSDLSHTASETELIDHPNQTQSVASSTDSVQRLSDLNETTPFTPSNVSQPEAPQTSTTQVTSTGNDVRNPAVAQQASEQPTANHHIAIQPVAIQRLPDISDNVSGDERLSAESAMPPSPSNHNQSTSQSSAVQRTPELDNTPSILSADNQPASASQPLKTDHRAPTADTIDNQANLSNTFPSVQRVSDTSNLSPHQTTDTERQLTPPPSSEPLGLPLASNQQPDITQASIPETTAVQPPVIQPSADIPSPNPRNELSTPAPNSLRSSDSSSSSPTSDLSPTLPVPAPSIPDGSIAAQSLQRQTDSPQSTGISQSPTAPLINVSSHQEITGQPAAEKTHPPKEVTDTFQVVSEPAPVQRQVDLSSGTVPDLLTPPSTSDGLSGTMPDPLTPPSSSGGLSGTMTDPLTPPSSSGGLSGTMPDPLTPPSASDALQTDLSETLPQTEQPQAPTFKTAVQRSTDIAPDILHGSNPLPQVNPTQPPIVETATQSSSSLSPDIETSLKEASNQSSKSPDTVQRWQTSSSEEQGTFSQPTINPGGDSPEIQKVTDSPRLNRLNPSKVQQTPADIEPLPREINSTREHLSAPLSAPPPTASLQRNVSDLSQSAPLPPMAQPQNQADVDHGQQVSKGGTSNIVQPHNESPVEAFQISQDASNNNLPKADHPQSDSSPLTQVQRTAIDDSRSFLDSGTQVQRASDGESHPTDAAELTATIQRSPNATPTTPDSSEQISDTSVTPLNTFQVRSEIALQRLSDDNSPPQSSIPLGAASSGKTLGTLGRKQGLRVLKPLGVLKPLPALQTGSVAIARQIEPSPLPSRNTTQQSSSTSQTSTNSSQTSSQTSTDIQALTDIQSSANGQASTNSQTTAGTDSSASNPLNNPPQSTQPDNGNTIQRNLDAGDRPSQAMPDEWSNLESLVAGLNSTQQSNSTAENTTNSHTTDGINASASNTNKLQRQPADTSSQPTTDKSNSPNESPSQSSGTKNDTNIQRQPDTGSVPNEWSNLEDLVTHLQSSSSQGTTQSTDSKSSANSKSSAKSNSKSPSASPAKQSSSTTKITQPATVTVQRQRASPTPTTKPTIIQACQDDSAVATANSSEDQAQDANRDYSQYLELLVQEVYGLLRQRLSLEQERRGPKYPR